MSKKTANKRHQNAKENIEDYSKQVNDDEDVVLSEGEAM
jgi:hypothetical protein